MKKMLWLLLSLCGIPGFPALADQHVAIQIEDAWARESPPTVSNGAAYLTLINAGKDTDRLLSASGDVAKTIELHTHLMDNNVMRMRRIDAIEVAPGEPTVLRPGGLHIMLIDLKQPLVAGQAFPLKLRFEKAGEIPVEISVRGKDGGAMPAAHGHHPEQK